MTLGTEVRVVPLREDGAPGHADGGAQVRISSDARRTEILVTVTGDLDRSSSPVLATAWARTSVVGVLRVRVDLLGVPFCDAAGLRAVAQIVEACRTGGVEWELAAAGLLARCLAIVGLDLHPGSARH